MRSAPGDSYIPGSRGTHPQSTAEPQDKLLDELDNESGVGVPILMYHRIATEGPMDLEQFRVDPILFDEQLSALRQVGIQERGKLPPGSQPTGRRSDVSPPDRCSRRVFAGGVGAEGGGRRQETGGGSDG